MIEYNVDMTSNEFAFRNFKFIFLWGKVDCVAPGTEFVAQVAYAACRNRNIFYWKFVFTGNIQKRVKNVRLVKNRTSRRNFFCFCADFHISLRRKRNSPSVNDERNSFIVLQNVKRFFRHKNGIAFFSHIEARTFQNCLCTNFPRK